MWRLRYLIYRDGRSIRYITPETFVRKAAKALTSRHLKVVRICAIDTFAITMQDTPHPVAAPLHVVARLAKRIREARAMGFQIRQEFLGGHPGSWCEIAGRKTVFLDASHSAVEQLSTLEEAIQSYRPAL